MESVPESYITSPNSKTSLIRLVLEFRDVIYVIGHQIEQFQWQATIICSGAYRHTKYESLQNELGWESLSSHRRQHKLILFFKILNRIYSLYLHNFIKFNYIGPYNLRHTSEIVPRFTRLSFTSRSFFPSTTRDWNRLANSVQNSLSVVTFKSLIRDTNILNFALVTKVFGCQDSVWS